MSRQSMIGLAAPSLLLWLAFPSAANAYLDPASGSILLQVILGGIAGAGLLIRMYWAKLLQLFGLGKAGNDESEN